MEKWMLIFLCCSFVFATDYYVSSDGIASWSACSNINSPCSLSTANTNAGPGDTVYLREGTYSEYINPDNSGTESSRLVYKNYNNENVTIYDTRYGILLEDKSYISVEGIHFYNLEQFMFILRSHHNEVSFCTFNHGRNVAQWTGSIIRYSSTYNKVLNCTFWDFGKTGVQPGDNDGAMLDIGTIDSTTDNSFYNLVEGNHFYECGHHCFGFWSKYSVFRNNYLHNDPWGPLNMGYRTAITHGRSNGWNLIEGNRFAFADGSAVGLRSENNIFRQNMFYNNELGGLQIVGMSGGYNLPVNTLVYNNVFYKNGHGADYAPFSGGIYFADWNNVGPLEGNEFRNNIFFDNAGGAFTYDSDVPERINVIENNYEGDPMFVSDMSIEYTPFGEQPDFRLTKDSSCVDSGGPLTTITSVDGTGTVFNVENPWYFYDGWTIPGEVGDMVQLEGDSVQAQVIDVDYDTGQVAVDTDLTWLQGQGIGLAYSGAAPDMGAYEYESSCEDAADCLDIVCNQKSCVGGTCTYAPADEGILCYGACRKCSEGYCKLDDSTICREFEVCSQGSCIGNPECVTLQDVAGAVSSWKNGLITMPELMEKIAAWKAGC